MADFLPVEANKAHILMVRPATQGTSLEDANAEWVEVFVDLSSDLANWRLQHLRGRWREETAKPVEWEWRGLSHPLGLPRPRGDPPRH